MPRRRGSSPMPPSPVTAWRARSRSPMRSCRCPTSAKSRCGEPRTCPAGDSSSSTRLRLLDVSRTDAVTRILFEAFPTAEVRLFYALGYTAIGVFCYGVYVQVRKYRRGAVLQLQGGLWSRFADMVEIVLSHRTVA